MIPYEQKKKLQKKIANMKYRAKHGGLVGVGPGRRPRTLGKVLTDMSQDGMIRQEVLQAPVAPIETRLTTKSSVEDFDNEILRLNDELIKTGAPAAIAKGVETLVKMSEIKRKAEPPVKIERKPRPRIVIKIEED